VKAFDGAIRFAGKAGRQGRSISGNDQGTGKKWRHGALAKVADYAWRPPGQVALQRIRQSTCDLF